jgi:hypothetical protein
VKVSLTVPRAARGHTVRVTLSIDPVPGDPPENNTSSRQVQIPRPPPVGRPDLAVSGLRLHVSGNELLVHGVVANVGRAAAANVGLELLAPGWPRGERSIARLASGAATPVHFVLAISKGARGHRVAFRLRAIPVSGERDLTNNGTFAQVTPPLHPPPPPPAGRHRSWAGLIGWVAGSLLAACLGVGFTLRGRQLRVRARWQKEADPARPDRCQVPETHVLRSGCKVKPALRKIERLELIVTGAGEDDERRTALDGKIIKTLNRAVWAHRVRRRRRVQELTEPLAEHLTAEIERWLASNERREVAIDARIKGGKLQCEFKRSECVRDGNACRWEEQQRWKGKIAQEVVEPISTLHLPLEPRPERIRQLGADLLGFVSHVDVPWRLRAPEAIPLPRE